MRYAFGGRLHTLPFFQLPYLLFYSQALLPGHPAYFRDDLMRCPLHLRESVLWLEQVRHVVGLVRHLRIRVGDLTTKKERVRGLLATAHGQGHTASAGIQPSQKN